jgi:hypothetical protein
LSPYRGGVHGTTYSSTNRLGELGLAQSAAWKFQRFAFIIPKPGVLKQTIAHTTDNAFIAALAKQLEGFKQAESAKNKVLRKKLDETNTWLKDTADGLKSLKQKYSRCKLEKTFCLSKSSDSSATIKSYEARLEQVGLSGGG